MRYIHCLLMNLILCFVLCGLANGQPQISVFPVSPPFGNVPHGDPDIRGTKTVFSTHGISGTRTIGSGGDYGTLKQAFDSINVNYISDTLRLVLIDSIYHEPQLLLQLASGLPVPPPLIIAPLSGSAHISIADSSGEEAGIHLMNSPNVRFDHIRITLDTPSGWWTVVRLEGTFPGTQFSHVDLDGGSASLGIEAFADSASLEVRGCTMEHVGAGMYLGGLMSVTMAHSIISNNLDFGISFDACAGAVRIDSNIFDGNNAACAAMSGTIQGRQLSFSNNTVTGYRAIGIEVDGFSFVEPSFTAPMAKAL